MIRIAVDSDGDVWIQTAQDCWTIVMGGEYDVDEVYGIEVNCGPFNVFELNA